MVNMYHLQHLLTYNSSEVLNFVNLCILFESGAIICCTERAFTLPQIQRLVKFLHAAFWIIAAHCDCSNVITVLVVSSITAYSWVLVHPASKTHWATRFLQLFLSSAASSTSSQLMPIFLRSFLTTSFQYCRGRPGLLL